MLGHELNDPKAKGAAALNRSPARKKGEKVRKQGSVALTENPTTRSTQAYAEKGQTPRNQKAHPPIMQVGKFAMDSECAGKSDADAKGIIDELSPTVAETVTDDGLKLVTQKAGGDRQQEGRDHLRSSRASFCTLS